jgi:hypothetical protein
MYGGNVHISDVQLRHLLTVYNIQEGNGHISAVELRHLLTVYKIHERNGRISAVELRCCCLCIIYRRGMDISLLWS